MKHPRLVAALVAGVSLPALAACTDNSSSSDQGDSRTINVTSSDDACDLSTDTCQTVVSGLPLLTSIAFRGSTLWGVTFGLVPGLADVHPLTP